MALIKRGRTKRLVLDIGSSAIRLCELSQTKAGFQLTKYFQKELGIDPALDEEEKVAIRQEGLEELLKESKVRTKKTILAVPGQSVFTRNRPLPPVPEYKVTQIVRYEIQQQIPFSLDQIALDYQVLERTEAGGYEVMMAAIKGDVVDKQVDILHTLRPRRSIDIVDVAPLAAYNWVHQTGEFGDTGECVALIDIGATTTDIVIQKDNQFRFTRSLSVGGNDITQALADGFNISFAEAEKLKRDKAFAPTGDAERDGKGGELVGEALNRMVGEINRSLAYFRSQPGGGPTNRIIIAGGCACLRNIIPYLQNQLGIEVRIAQPLAGIAVSPAANMASEHPEQACVVLGLALRCCANVPIQINLIPPRIIEAARQREQAFYWLLSLVTMLLIMASIIPVTAAKDDLVKGRIKFLEGVLAQYDRVYVRELDAFSQKESDLKVVKDSVEMSRKDVRALDHAHMTRHYWPEYIKAINDARPSGGGIVCSSIETAVIGGRENTGDAVRNLTPEELDAGMVEDQLPEEPVSRGRNPFGGRGGRAEDSVNDKYEDNLNGFPGIFDGGAPPTEPNGFVVLGYAQDYKALISFEDNLKANPVFGKHRVYVHIEDVAKVAKDELDNAQIGGDFGEVTKTASSSVGGMDIGMSFDMGGMMPPMGGMMPPMGGGFGGGSPALLGPVVVHFRVDVQFRGRPQKFEN